MKKLMVMLMLSGVVMLCSSAIERIQKSAGPPSCHANEPPNGGNCTECHNDGVLNSGTAGVQFDLGGADTDYVAGKTYTITVSVSKSGMQRAGFQCIALQDNDNKISPGDITLTDPNRTQRLDKNTPHSGGCTNEERVWIEHTFVGCNSTNGTSTWSYQWKAPAVGVGPITFYLAALEANNDLAETGDKVYAVKKAITGLPVGLPDTDPDWFTVYPQPARGSMQVQYLHDKPESIALLNSEGKFIRQLNFKEGSAKTVSVDVSGLDAGVYLLKVKAGEQSGYRKVSLYE